jgi:pimeloyl-ACP methyl ester carboxylesterase
MPFAQIGSKSIFYTLTTPDASTPKTHFTLLCIHGLGSSSSFYAPITSHLTSLGHTVLAIDTQGSGLSPYDASSGNTTTSIADDALAVLDSIQAQVPRDVVVLGHSMGGIVASEIALKSPDKIKGVMLIGPVNPNPNAAEVFGKRIAIVEREGMEPLAMSIPASATGTKASPVVHAFIRSLLLASQPDGYISLCRAIAEARVPDYKVIEAPLLIIAGEEDKSAPVEGSTRILEAYGSGRKEQKVLPGVGHWHVLEAHEDVGRLVGEFVASL